MSVKGRLEWERTRFFSESHHIPTANQVIEFHDRSCLGWWNLGQKSAFVLGQKMKKGWMLVACTSVIWTNFDQILSNHYWNPSNKLCCFSEFSQATHPFNFLSSGEEEIKNLGERNFRYLREDFASFLVTFHKFLAKLIFSTHFSALWSKSYLFPTDFHLFLLESKKLVRKISNLVTSNDTYSPLK